MTSTLLGNYQNWYSTETPQTYDFGSKYPQNYYNLSGYPNHDDYNSINSEVYYDYYDYEPQPESYPQPITKKSDQVVISPHPVTVAVKRWLSGLKNGIQTSRQDLSQQLSGNTKVRFLTFSVVSNFSSIFGLSISQLLQIIRIFLLQYLALAVTLGTIGVVGFVYQVTKRWQENHHKTIEKLSKRITSLENQRFHHSDHYFGINSAFSQTVRDTAEANCNKLREITNLGYSGGISVTNNYNFIQRLIAIQTNSCPVL